MTGTSFKPNIFLSCSSRDKEAADEVIRALTEAEFDVFADADLQAGSTWRDAIRGAMLESDAFVVVASSDTADSPWLALEVGAAMGWGKPIHVVSTDDGPLPVHLQHLQVTRLSDLPGLIRSVRRETRPLSRAERDLLTTIYVGVGVPTDKLMLDPDAATQLVEEFNRRTRTTTSADRLLRELLRLRKVGRLPRLRRVVRNADVKSSRSSA